MTHEHRIIRNAFWNWINLGLSLIISFLLMPFVVHKLGSLYYGIWALVSQMTGYLWLLDFGVRESVIKYVAEYRAKNNMAGLGVILSSALRLYTIICIICIIASFLLAALFNHIFDITLEALNTTRIVVLLIGIDISLMFIFNVFVGILMGLQRYDIFSQISIFISVIKAVATFIILHMGYGLIALSCIQLIGNLCTNGCVYYLSRKQISITLNPFNFATNITVNKMLATYGFYVFINNISQQAIFYSSNFIIALFQPIHAVTFYAIPATLVEYMKKLVFAITQVFNPLTSEFSARDENARIRMLLVQGSKFSLLLSIPSLVLYVVMGRQFLTLWVGFEFALESCDILTILSIVTFLSIPHYTMSGILLGMNKHKITALCRFFEAVINISLTVALVRSYGILGVAIGGAIPHLLVVLIFLPFFTSRLVGLGYWEYVKQSYISPFASALLFAIVSLIMVRMFPPSSLSLLMAEVCLLLPVYVTTVWIVSLNRQEKEYAKARVLQFVRSNFVNNLA